MNKAFIQTKSGDIIVFDENGTPRQIENSNSLDNLNKKLTQENIVEESEKRIKELEEALEGQPSMEEINKRKYIPQTLPALAVALFLSIFIIYFLGGNPDIFTTTVNTIFGPIKEIFAMFIPIALCCTAFGIMIEFLRYTSYKIYVKDINAKTIELEALRDRLQKDKNKLEQLKLVETKSIENQQFDFKITSVNDKEELKKLEWYSTYYYSLGYDLAKYYKAYQKGTLDTLLQKKGYEEHNRRLMTEYVKEKGPVLARRKTPRRGKNNYNNK